MNLFNNTKVALSVILFCTCIVFWPVIHNGFVNWDDPAYVLQNPFVLTLNFPTLIKSFQTSVEHTYVPLSTLSLAVDHALFGFNPIIFHLENLLFHLINVIFVYLLAIQLGIEKKGAWLGAFLFALHPLQAESVSWVTERKGLLSAMFYLLAMRFYIFYIQKNKIKDYWIAIVAGFLSMLAKPMGYSLPLVFFLVDWWLKRTFNFKVIVEKILPMMIVAMLSALTFSKDFLGQPYGQIEKILIWSWAINFYLIKFLWPFNLSPLYDLPQPINLHNPVYILSIFIILIFLWITYRLRKHRLFIFSVLFFLLTIGILIIRAGWKFGSFTVVADRFMYLPGMGFCLVIGNMLIRLFERSKDANAQKMIRWLIIFIIINFGILTFKQTQIWENSLTLWTKAIDINSQQSLAYVNRADYFREKGELDKAKTDLAKALYCNPQSFMAYHLLGIVEADLGNLDSALEAFNQTELLNAAYKDVYLNRGNVYLKLGRLDEALIDFNKHLDLAPQSFQAYSYRGIVLNMMSKNDLALRSLNHSLEIYPNYVEGLINRGTFFAIQRNYKDALKDFDRALKLEPKNLNVIKNRDLVLKNLK